MPHLILYGTAGCHLCESAERLLDEARHLGPEPLDLRLRDIADDPALMERYGVRIPVLREPGSGAELGWPFDAGRLRDFLDSLPR